jgi:hypothetical protein
VSRVFFPTDRMKLFGVRDSGERPTLTTLSGWGGPGSGDGPMRFPAEIQPHAAMNPTPSLAGLGLMVAQRTNLAPRNTIVPVIRYVQPPTSAIVNLTLTAGQRAIEQQQHPDWDLSHITTAMATQIMAEHPDWFGQAPAVSAQQSPTPTVNTPAVLPTTQILVSSSGGAPTPATSTIVTPPPVSASVVDQVFAWLGGSTVLMGYTVPNAALAAVVGLAAAALLRSDGKRR